VRNHDTENQEDEIRNPHVVLTTMSPPGGRWDPWDPPMKRGMYPVPPPLSPKSSSNEKVRVLAGFRKLRTGDERALCHQDTHLNVEPEGMYVPFGRSRWGHQGLCTAGQQPTQGSSSFEFITRFASVGHWGKGNTIAFEELAEDLAGRGQLVCSVSSAAMLQNGL
jgi:hypothetical protein